MWTSLIQQAGGRNRPVRRTHALNCRPLQHLPQPTHLLPAPWPCRHTFAGPPSPLPAPPPARPAPGGGKAWIGYANNHRWWLAVLWSMHQLGGGAAIHAPLVRCNVHSCSISPACLPRWLWGPAAARPDALSRCAAALWCRGTAAGKERARSSLRRTAHHMHATWQQCRCNSVAKPSQHKSPEHLSGRATWPLHPRQHPTCSREYGSGANSMPTQLLLPSVSLSRRMRPLRSVSPLARDGCEMSDTALQGGGQRSKRPQVSVRVRSSAIRAGFQRLPNQRLPI